MKNLFKIAKDKTNQKECLFCDVKFTPDKRNLNRGWGLCCSKSCASSFKNKYKYMTKEDRIREKRNDILKQIGI